MKRALATLTGLRDRLVQARDEAAAAQAAAADAQAKATAQVDALTVEITEVDQAIAAVEALVPPA